MPPIYLDYNASTPIDPAVAKAMQPFLKEAFGNPSSGHWASTPAKAALERARTQVAALIGAAPDEIVFTSGGSEANNLAIKGTFFAPNRHGAHIITSAIEHPAVLAPCRFLERLGASVTHVPVDRTGGVDPDGVRRAITPQTTLISIMHANNEVGTIQPIRMIGEVAREHGIRFHTDAAQSVGKISTNVNELSVDFLSIAGHKLYAPKGVGALYVRGGLELEPLIHGADHELGRRAGTESVLLAVGLGAASALGQDLAPMERVRALRDGFWHALQDRFGDHVVLNVCDTSFAQHPQRVICRQDRCGYPGTTQRCRGIDWFSVPLGTDRALARSCRDGRAGENWNGSSPLQPRAHDDER